MKQEHTPTPWEVQDEIGIVDYENGGLISVVDNFKCGTSIPGDEREANAAHIVKCVNAHDGLVEVLRMCRKGFVGIAETMAIDAALKAAGEEV